MHSNKCIKRRDALEERSFSFVGKFAQLHDEDHKGLFTHPLALKLKLKKQVTFGSLAFLHWLSNVTRVANKIYKSTGVGNKFQPDTKLKTKKEHPWT